jgi:hypothetical protein
MHTTKVTRTLALAGFAPAGKPGNVNRQERLDHTARNRRECRIRSTRSPQHSGQLWLACALAAMGIVTAKAQASGGTGKASHEWMATLRTLPAPCRCSPNPKREFGSPGRPVRPEACAHADIERRGATAGTIGYSGCRVPRHHNCTDAPTPEVELQ